MQNWLNKTSQSADIWKTLKLLVARITRYTVCDINRHESNLKFLVSYLAMHGHSDSFVCVLCYGATYMFICYNLCSGMDAKLIAGNLERHVSYAVAAIEFLDCQLPGVLTATRTDDEVWKEYNFMGLHHAVSQASLIGKFNSAI